jgi:hypothetical protein
VVERDATVLCRDCNWLNSVGLKAQSIGPILMLFDEYKYAYYYTLRLKARERVVISLNKRLTKVDHREKWKGITLASIKQDALDYALFKWSKYYDGETHCPLPITWERLYYSFSQRYAHFNVAVWQRLDGVDVLRGMAFGKPSGGRAHLTINWLERSPEPDYFKGGILLPILSCAEEYAKLLGCQRVLIKNPLHEEEFGKYGYTKSEHAPKGALYLGKELNQ